MQRPDPEPGRLAHPLLHRRAELPREAPLRQQGVALHARNRLLRRLVHPLVQPLQRVQLHGLDVPKKLKPNRPEPGARAEVEVRAGAQSHRGKLSRQRHLQRRGEDQQREAGSVQHGASDRAVPFLQERLLQARQFQFIIINLNSWFKKSGVHGHWGL